MNTEIDYKKAWRGATYENDSQARLIATLESALRYAASWIGEVPHGDNCFVSNHYVGDPGNQCNCGKDSVLDVMNRALPDPETGLKRVPVWKGYALLGSGLYAINHSADFDPVLGAELIITLATEEEKAGRKIGEARDYSEGRPPIQPDDMVIRIGFLSERALFALEDQLSEIRKLHFTSKESESEQSAFEDWLIAKSPSGDVTSVQEQWEASSEFSDFKKAVP